jgi:hypothetical protein
MNAIDGQTIFHLTFFHPNYGGQWLLFCQFENRFCGKPRICQKILRINVWPERMLHHVPDHLWFTLLLGTMVTPGNNTTPIEKIVRQGLRFCVTDKYLVIQWHKLGFGGQPRSKNLLAHHTSSRQVIKVTGYTWHFFTPPDFYWVINDKCPQSATVGVTDYFFGCQEL